METAVAKNEAEVRQLAAGMAVLGAELVGSDTFARAGELGPLIMAGARPASELVELFRSGYRRVQAARIVQAAVRCCLRRPLGPNRETKAREPVRPGSVEMWEQGAAQEPSLQRLRHGACRAWEVHAATGRCAMPLKLWLTSDPAARRYRFFAKCLGVPKARRKPLAIRMRRGVDAAIMASVGLARAHAARQIQWWFQLWQLRRSLSRHAAGQAQLEAWQEARKAQRRAARARARAGDVGAGSSAGRIEAPPESTARAAVAVGEGRAASGQAGVRCSLEGRHRWAGAAFFVTAALWGLASRPALVLSPAAVHHLPRPPGVRFGGFGGGSSAVDLRLRWLWMQASPAAVLAVVQGAARGASGRGGQAGVGDGYGRLDAGACVGLATRGAFQPAALCEANRLAEGPWALPRPPELERRESWWAAKILRQERGGLANTVDEGEGGPVVTRLQRGGLIVGELAERCKCVSRWPEHTAALCCWRKGHPDLVHPDVVLAASALSGRVRRSGHSVRPLTTELFSVLCQWRRSGASGQRAPAHRTDDVQVGV